MAFRLRTGESRAPMSPTITVIAFARGRSRKNLELTRQAHELPVASSRSRTSLVLTPRQHLVPKLYLSIEVCRSFDILPSFYAPFKVISTRERGLHAQTRDRTVLQT